MEKTYTEEEKKVILKAKEKALNLLSYSDKTEALLRDKLKEGEFPPFAVEEAIAYVKSFHYLDDRRYAENYLRSHRELKSIREMREALREKGVGPEDLEAAFSEIEIDETATVKSLFLKKYRYKDVTDPKLYEKAFRYFGSKGFPYQETKRGIREALEERSSEAEA